MGWGLEPVALVPKMPGPSVGSRAVQAEVAAPALPRPTLGLRGSSTCSRCPAWPELPGGLPVGSRLRVAVDSRRSVQLSTCPPQSLGRHSEDLGVGTLCMRSQLTRPQDQALSPGQQAGSRREVGGEEEAQASWGFSRAFLSLEIEQPRVQLRS